MPTRTEQGSTCSSDTSEPRRWSLLSLYLFLSLLRSVLWSFIQEALICSVRTENRFQSLSTTTWSFGSTWAFLDQPQLRKLFIPGPLLCHSDPPSSHHILHQIRPPSPSTDHSPYHNTQRKPSQSNGRTESYLGLIVIVIIFIFPRGDEQLRDIKLRTARHRFPICQQEVVVSKLQTEHS